MNLDEFHKAMESEATVANERLKRDIAEVEKRYHELAEFLFCELSDYRCKHAMSIDDKVKTANKLMEETRNA